jgi:hypothetical protein
LCNERKFIEGKVENSSKVWTYPLVHDYSLLLNPKPPTPAPLQHTNPKKEKKRKEEKTPLHSLKDSLVYLERSIDFFFYNLI